MKPFHLAATAMDRLFSAPGPHAAYRNRAMEYFYASDVKGYHAGIAASFHAPEDQQVLVVGCSRGDDCRYFIDFGAATVVGIDLEPEIGVNFLHPRVLYRRESVEQLSFDSKSFDLVFSFATLEHVHNIEAAYSEMVRVLKPGGTVYCHAAPLWNSRSGPHWGNSFSCVPWAHLRLSKKDIHNINEILQRYSAAQIDYFLDERFFNRRPARDYLAAGWGLPSVEVLRNFIDLEDDAGIPPGIFRDLSGMGYSRLELLGLSHTLVARKL